MCGALSSFAQDTTSLRWVGINDVNNFNFFKNDSTDLTNFTASYGAGFGVFMNSQDSLLYAVMGGGVSAGTDRNLYQINPFTGATTLILDLTIPYISSADISADGKTLYVIQGQGGSSVDLGKITAINIATGTETFLTTALGDPGNSSYGMEFNPTDSSLYIFEGSWVGATRVQKIDLATLANTNVPMVGWTTQLHGALYTGTASKFIVTAGYGCNMLITDNSANNLVSFYNSCPYRTTDIEEIKTLRAPSNTISICPNTTDSVMISLIYEGTNFQWFKDGVLLSETNDTLMAFDAGVYRALIEIESTGNYMWSEPITITHATVPVVNITQATNDTLICPGDVITLNGASGGTLQWYRNGSIIAGATSSTYGATLSGVYNQTKTNTSGCVDSAAVSYVILDDAGCASGLNEFASANVVLYPNPVNTILSVESSELINAVVVVDMIGKQVYRMDNVAKTFVNVDLSTLVKGSYFVRVKTTNGEIIKKIQK